MALPSRTLPTVSIVARPHLPSAWIRLASELDMATEHALTEAAQRLRPLTLRLIIIDLTAVTFTCVLHRPSPLAAVMVTAAGLDGLVMRTGGSRP